MVSRKDLRTCCCANAMQHNRFPLMHSSTKKRCLCPCFAQNSCTVQLCLFFLFFLKGHDEKNVVFFEGTHDAECMHMHVHVHVHARLFFLQRKLLTMHLMNDRPSGSCNRVARAKDAPATKAARRALKKAVTAAKGQRLNPRLAWAKIKELTAGPRGSIIRHVPELKLNVDQRMTSING